MKSEIEHDECDPNCWWAMHKSRLQFSEKTCQDIEIAKKNWTSWEYMLHYHNIHESVILRGIAPNIVCLYSRVAVVTDSLSILMVNGLYVLNALEGNDNIDILLTGVLCMLTI